MNPANLIASLGLLAQATPDATTVVGARIESVWDFVMKGGPAMAAILLCSLVALTIVVERLIVLRKRCVIPPGFVSALSGLAADRGRALEYCSSDGSPLANVCAAAVQRAGHPREQVEKAVEGAGRREIVRLRQRMRVLGALPQVSTMLGLLGTIFGMIKTFQAVAASGQALGKTELLAKGIFEAWTCTAAGLLVAIPVLVAYHALMGRIDGLIAQLDKTVVDWLATDSQPLLTGGTAQATRPVAAQIAPNSAAPLTPELTVAAASQAC
ncbi:MAG: MotA/TolQ/ExbB proton channel family protein [Planctomycetes bacterium]|nr:MotA/TolQ/ExbB proton channel family protein [Planctomycetota bacterium]